mmetsp:Transcript_27173/g.74190  ORF Transcript_27173/g.74190 Transcript_27173/m.74190 type:complete len:343 (+) Transcript_27173:3030-4058(+)
MLHLDARVHLNEVVTPFGVNKELDSARILIVRARHQLERVLMQFLAELRVKRPSWRNLNNLLVATLHRAVALPQVNSVALTVADDLDFNVPGTLDIALEENRAISEGGLGFRRSGLVEGREVLNLADHAHSLATPAHGCLNNYGQTILLDKGVSLLLGGDRLISTRYHRHIGLDGSNPSRRLVREGLQIFDSGTHKGDAGIGACLRKLRRLAEEAIARMDGVNALLLGDADDLLNIEVRGDGWRVWSPLLEQKGLVSTPTVLREAVLVAVDGDSRHVELGGGAHDADGDLGTVGSHQLLEGWGRLPLAQHSERVGGECRLGHLLILRHREWCAPNAERRGRA